MGTSTAVDVPCAHAASATATKARGIMGKSLGSGDRGVEGSGRLLTTVDDEIAGVARCPAAGAGDGDRHTPRSRRAISKIERDAPRRRSPGGRVSLPLHLDTLRLIA